MPKNDSSISTRLSYDATVFLSFPVLGLDTHIHRDLHKHLHITIKEQCVSTVRKRCFVNKDWSEGMSIYYDLHEGMLAFLLVIKNEMEGEIRC